MIPLLRISLGHYVSIFHVLQIEFARVDDCFIDVRNLNDSIGPSSPLKTMKNKNKKELEGFFYHHKFLLPVLSWVPREIMDYCVTCLEPTTSTNIAILWLHLSTEIVVPRILRKILHHWPDIRAFLPPLELSMSLRQNGLSISNACRNVYIVYGSISHWDGWISRNKTDERDKRKN